MKIKWQVKFKSLRAGTDYTVNIYDQTYTGDPIRLKGGASPFVTEEDDDDDPFVPIRIQTGHLRIVDDGYAADGVTPFDWKDFVPQTDHSRPVTLTDGSGNVCWQGFMQAQDFSGELYGNPQERNFPIHCPIAVLKSQQPSTENIQLRNFAYVIDLAAATAEALSVQTVGFDTFYVQGSSDARLWLLKQFDWMNVLKEGDDGEDIAPQYNLYEILEDICRFWGWTCRTKGRTMYFMCADDQDEQMFLVMTRAQLRQMVLGTAAGTVTTPFTSYTLQGDIFASTDNEDMKRRGPSKATVKADCNEQDTVFEFAPPSVEKLMDNTGYTWVAGEEDSTGYFTTSPIRSFETAVMKGSSTAYGGFCRRQIYSTTEADNPTKEDMMIVKEGYTYGSNVIQLQTKKVMNFTGGSLKISGDIFIGEKKWEWTDGNDFIALHVGIGMSYTSAKWFYLTINGDLPGQCSASYGWSASQSMLQGRVTGGGFKEIGNYKKLLLFATAYFTYPGIPCNENLYGYVFVDICGMKNEVGVEDEATTPKFDVGNLKITFSRDEVFIPTATNQTRARTLDNPRISSLDYTAVNTNGCGNEWNCDLIYASDNNMQYGYGLIREPGDGTFMKTARYGNQQEHPEQHLANRVASFWQSSKRQVTPELRTEAIPDVSPLYRLTLESAWRFDPIAISHNWHDDVTILTLLQSTI